MKLLLCGLVFMIVISCDVRAFAPVALFIYLAIRWEDRHE
jgi:hypothetical protein